MQRKRKDKYRLLKTMITARFLPSLVGFIQSRKARLLFFALSLSLSLFLFLSLTVSLILSSSLSFDHSPLSSCSPFRSISTSLCVRVFYFAFIWVSFVRLSPEISRFQENCSRKIGLHFYTVLYFSFFFSYDSSYDLFTFYDLHIVDLKLHIVFSRLKMWSKPFVSVLRIFISIYFSMKKKSIYIYCVSICILRYFFFFFTYTIYNVDFLFILGYSVSSRLFD